MNLQQLTRHAPQTQLAYVSRWYFSNKWRGVGLPPEPGVRERMIDELVAGGWLEGYAATDDKGRVVQAVRIVEAGPVGPQAGAERSASGG